MKLITSWIRSGLLILALVAGTGLVASPAQASPNCAKATLSIGASGTCVKALQDALSIRGIPPGIAGSDGKYGHGTANAVKEYQKLYGLKVDGRAGPATWSVMAKNPKPHAKILNRLSPRWSERGTIAIVDKIGTRGKPAVSNVARVYLFREGKLLRTIQARTGGKAYDPNDGRWYYKNTPTGAFKILRRVENEYSRKYNAKMPYSVYFTQNGMALHYSESFMKYGYGPEGNLGSNGCINMNKADAQLVFNSLTSGRNQLLIQQTN